MGIFTLEKRKMGGLEWCLVQTDGHSPHQVLDSCQLRELADLCDKLTSGLDLPTAMDMKLAVTLLPPAGWRAGEG